ncbi:MAG: alpha/beta fold hydrolase [Bacteroidales bacterium]|jgi:phosphoglycolate phosphatase-like HAD superfamily hydrolase/pimeloyl-ACP methyl ester carboxylesterase|nr:alpha/beta fold hydrolase [Bacteroidales bacterium]
MSANKNLHSEIAFKRIDNYPGKPTIIFLHDSWGSINLLRDFPEKLGELTECNVLIYDRQGYGESGPFSYSKRNNDYMELEADILNELLDYWKIDKAILFGHSDGGSISLITAAKYPSKIVGVITEGAHVFVEDITVNGIKDAVKLYQTGNLKSKLEKYHGEKTDSMFWAWADTWTSEEFRTWNIESFLPAIHCDLLVIQGADDEYGTLEQVTKIVTQTSGQASKLIIPNAKHSPHKEVPNLVLEKSAEFIKQLFDDENKNASIREVSKASFRKHKNKFKGIIFDLDGTLVNSLEDLAGSMNKVLQNHNFPTHSLADYKIFVGKGILNLVRSSLPKTIQDEQTVKSCYQQMVSIYKDNCIIKTAPYDGIIDLLNELKYRKIKLAVLSNKADELTKKIVQTLMPDYFDVVLGLTSEELRKPNPFVALKISNFFQIDSENMIYVGDSGIDMQTAQNAKMFGVGVTWGFRTEEELIVNGAQEILNHPSDLIKIIS